MTHSGGAQRPTPHHLAWLLLCVALAGCQTSIDFDAGRAWACTFGGPQTECTPGWRCGRDEHCHRIGDEQPWACEATTDCEGTWVCGLEGTCHDPTVLASYRCTTDEHCVAPWRCGFAGRCLDATAEVNEPVAATAGVPALVNPRFFFGQGQLGATSDLYAIGVGTTVKLITDLSRTDTLPVITVFDAGRPFVALVPEVLGVTVYDDAGTRGLYPPVYTPTHFTWVDDGGTWHPFSLGGPRVVDGEVVRRVGLTGGAPVQLPPRGNLLLEHQCRYAMTSDGLFVQPAQADTWEPISVPDLLHTSCALERTFPYEQLLVRQGGVRRRLIAVAARVDDGFIGPPVLQDGGGLNGRERNTLVVLDVTRLESLGVLPDGGSSRCLTTPVGELVCGDPRVDVLLSRCPLPCELGDELVDLRPTDSDLELECANRGGGGVSLMQVAYDGLCTTTLVTEPAQRLRDVQPERDPIFSPKVSVRTGKHGQLWVGESLARATPLLLDVAPLGARRLVSPVDGGGLDVWLTPRQAAILEPELGLLTRPSPAISGLVEGSELVVLPSGSVAPLRLPGGVFAGARVTALDTTIEPRQSVRGLLAADTLYVAVDDRLFIAPRAEWSARVPLRLVPSPGFTLRSLAPGAGDVRAWASTARGVVALREADGVWSSQDVALPGGAVLEVWADGPRARVAYADGRVLSLPSGVPLISAPASETFVDVLPVCGQLWGLTTKGLKRAVGTTWQDVALAGVDTIFDDTLGAGRLVHQGDRVFVFNGVGAAASFTTDPVCTSSLP